MSIIRSRPLNSRARRLIAGIALPAGIVLALSFASEAQPAASVPRIGFLLPASLSDPRIPAYLQAFRQGLRELGYVEGQNIAIEFRWAEGHYDRLPALAAELVRVDVSLIVAAGSPATRAVKDVTETVPIVMMNVSDPVAAGFVVSLAHPGGNITGLSLMSPELVGKQLELLKQILPTVSRVALLVNPTNLGSALLVRHAREAGRTLGIQVQVLEARDRGQIDGAFAALASERAGAVVVLSDPVFLDHRARIADHASRRRLPTAFELSAFAEAGGLLAYGPSLAAEYRRTAAHVDKILKGAKPGDLPVEQPVTFELVLNLGAAKTLGLTLPRAVLERADRVIR